MRSAKARRHARGAGGHAHDLHRAVCVLVHQVVRSGDTRYVTYGSHRASEGKRAFQTFNGMGCHTLVGNGAYLGPDLTKEYARVGPAWLAAFLPSADSWPTAEAVDLQLQNSDQRADARISSINAYSQKFPGAKSGLNSAAGAQASCRTCRSRRIRSAI